MTNPEDDQSMVESTWEKTWDNFYSNLMLKYGKKYDNLWNYNHKL